MHPIRRRTRRAVLGLLSFGFCAGAFAGFASTDAFLPAVGRIAGKDGAEFYTTVWATNLTQAPAHFTFAFLKGGQTNPDPASFTDTLAPGETKVYENVVETKLGLADALGAARVTSDAEILVAERIYNQAPGADLGDTEGLFFAGVPKTFSITAGQSASIQGINQGGSEDFRYNFALVETGGGSADVNVQVFDGSGALLGQKAFPLHPYEQLQPGVADVVANIHTTNARITATVTSGTGSVLLAGAQLANVSQDSSGFEMSFRDDILGSGGGTAGVASLNGLIGALTIAHGANTTVNVVGKTITIDAVAGSGTGLTSVAHDNSLTGSGTVALPLAIGSGQVVRSLTAGASTLHDAVTLAAGSNVTLTPAGNTITIAATGGGGGGLTLPFSGSAGSMSPAFTITNFGGGAGVSGVGDTGILGSGEGTGVYGESASINGIGVDGHGAGQGVKGTAAGANSIGVSGIGHTGVVGTGEGGGVLGGPGVYGVSPEAGVRGFGDAYGVRGDSDSGGFSAGVYGTDSSSGVGVFGETSNSTAYALYGKSHGLGYAGYFDGNVHVQGTFSKSGGSFKIDHPLDPTGKYLSHSFVESPDMMNIYNGIAGLDATGTARVALPEWFDALNRDFRYQLTAMGTPQPGLYVADEIHENSFRIAGGAPGARVSWQVTGIRHDVWADAHRIPVEEAKPGEEQGTYLEPELFGEPAEKSVRSSKERRRGE